METPFASRGLARWVCAGFVALLLLAFVVRSRGADATARLHQLVQQRVTANEFTGAVLVAKRGAPIFDRAYGQANREWGIANTTDTHFRIGSITKQFTAVAILLLEERGRLKLTDPVSAHLPDAPAAWSGITLHHLLTHTSGISNVTADPEFMLWKNQPATIIQMVGRFRDLPLDFPPGSRHAYSNSNYLVLGLLLEKLTGERYADFLRDNVLAPLGLRETGVDANLKILPRRATGYVFRNGGWFNAPYSDMSVPHAAGAMYSTTHDLWRWAEGVFHDKLLAPASRAKLLTPGQNEYALGVRVVTSRGRRAIEHGGSIAGFNSNLVHYPDDGVTVVVLANMNTRASSDLAWELAAATFASEPGAEPARTVVPVPVATLESYCGTYGIPLVRTNTVRLENGGLVMQLADQPAWRLFAESPTKFFLKDVDGTVEFRRDETGRVNRLVLILNGRQRTIPRIFD